MDDLISRKAAIESCLEIARQEHDEKDPLAIAWANGVRHAARVILPTVDAAPVVHGRWQWISSTYDRTPCEQRYMCSKCRHETITHDHEPWEKYCPNCGAKMDFGGTK